MSIYNGKLTAGVPYTSAGVIATSMGVYGAGGGGGATAASTAFTGGNGYAAVFGLATISAKNPSGKEIVRLNNDGTVTWNGEINIDEAAEAFSTSLSLGAELANGLTYAVKQRMRDTVFAEMISMAKEKGSLTADDLTYLHQAAKIMDKLKGKE